MEGLEQEIQDFNSLVNQISKLQLSLNQLEKVIIEKYCPYKKGDNVIYTEWYRGNGKDYFGKVESVRFKGVNPDAIDGKWIICVWPTTKVFVEKMGGYNSAFKYLGDHKGDIIRKA